jgi:hypothetical protein
MYRPATISLASTLFTVNKDDTVNGRPETAAFDAVLSRSLTVVGLGVTCTKAHVGNILRILHETGDSIDPIRCISN